ncbi:MAG: Ig-like domain-containing protein [Limisphaerales bacterium]
MNSLRDEGIWLDTDGTNQNGVLLVLGGNDQQGNWAYWHLVQNGSLSAPLDVNTSAFVPDLTYTVTVLVNGDTYQAYNDPDGVFDANSVLLTTLDDGTYTHGQVGLYDFYPATSFSNFSVSGVTNSPAPVVTESLKNDTGSSATDLITKDATLTGSGDPNAVMHFTVDGKSITDTANVDASGVWTFTPTGLVDGQHTIVASEAEAALTFTDGFSPASTLWSNSIGNWTSVGGKYFAQSPSNSPETYSGLWFNFTNTSFSLTVTISSLRDEGIWLDTDGSRNNGVLLVLGGNAQAGNWAYWHIAQNGSLSAPQDVNTNAFTPDLTYTVTVLIDGNTYRPTRILTASLTLIPCCLQHWSTVPIRTVRLGSTTFIRPHRSAIFRFLVLSMRQPHQPH